MRHSEVAHLRIRENPVDGVDLPGGDARGVELVDPLGRRAAAGVSFDNGVEGGSVRGARRRGGVLRLVKFGVVEYGFEPPPDLLT